MRDVIRLSRMVNELMPRYLWTILAVMVPASTMAQDPTAQSVRPGAMSTSTSDIPSSAVTINSIIYSGLSKAEMLDRLKPIVALMDSIDDFTQKTGLHYMFGFGSGAGVMDYSIEHCGLTLIVDADQRIRIIRRRERVVNGENYPEMSISEPGFEWKGYLRRYPN